MAQRSFDPAMIEAEIDRIWSLGLDALRAEWRATFGALPPSGLSKDIIGRMIAYRMQEEAFGGLGRNTRKHLDSLARGERHAAARLNRRLKPGTALIREYQGERHTVTVVPGGFVWQGTTYPSLSTIARAITGTSWNGPRFFNICAANGAKRKTKSAAAAKHPRHHRVPAASHGSRTSAGVNPVPLRLETTSQAGPTDACRL